MFLFDESVLKSLVKCVQQSSPGRNVAWSHVFVRPDVFYNNHDGHIPGSHHTQSTTIKKKKQLRRDLRAKVKAKKTVTNLNPLRRTEVLYLAYF